MESYIETVSGRKFYFLAPKPEDFDIEDIAHALSMNCRYTGHCSRFYSVAEHSILVSEILPPQLQLAGLLHDASEAYITDVASPIKQHLPDYQKMEDRIMSALATRFGIEYPLHPAVKYADLVMLSTEAWNLLPSQGNSWNLWEYRKRPLVHFGRKPMCLEPFVAKNLFLERFKELTYGQEHIN